LLGDLTVFFLQAGVAMLLTLSHADLCAAPGTPHADVAVSMELTTSAIQSCMNGLTESGVLPSLFEWMPHLLAALDRTTDAGASAGPDLSSAAAKDLIITICAGKAAKTGGCGSCNTRTSQHLVGRFVACSLEQLSGMTLPSASEQHSPGLMHSMIGGLGHLLIAPVVLAVLGNPGLLSVFADVSVHDDAPAHSLTVTKDNATLCHWQKILQIWLELKEFARTHGIDDESLHSESEGVVEPTWVDALLRSDARALSHVPFRAVLLADDPPGNNCSMRVIECTLSLAQAAAESVSAHRRKYPRSELTDTVTVAAAGLLVSAVANLNGFLTQQRNGDQHSVLKRVHEAVLVVQSTFTTTITLLSSPTLPHMAYVLSDVDGECVRRSYAATVYGGLLNLAATLHNFQSSAVDPGSAAVLKKYEQLWLLAALTGLCAHHSSSASAQSRGAFRSAAATLAVGAEYRRVLMDYARRVSAGCDKDCADMLLSAWAELGGDASELQHVLQSGGAGPHAAVVPATSVVTSKQPPLHTTPSSAVKRSFLAAVTSAGSSSSAPGSFAPPTKRQTLAAETPAGEFVKIAVAQGDLDALATKSGYGAKAKQGIVSVTYTGADRTDLNAQSQQLQSQQVSQLLERQASQQVGGEIPASAPGIVATAAPPLSTSAADVERPPLAVSAQVERGAALTSPARPVVASAAPVTTQQHSDSTTYISPSPAAAGAPSLPLSAAAITRIQSGYFHSNFASVGYATASSSASKRLLSAREPALATGGDKAGHEAIQAEEEVAILQKHSQIAQHEIFNSGEDKPGVSTSAAAQHASTEARCAEAAAASGDAAEGISSVVLRTQQRLRECIAVLNAVQHATAGAPGGAVTDGVQATAGTAENTEQALSAAIRDSHRLTGLLLELWNKSRNSSP
jgi:hypothetical protein